MGRTSDKRPAKDELAADRAALDLSELFHGQTGVYVPPQRFRHIIDSYWRMVSEAAHTIHDVGEAEKPKLDPCSISWVDETNNKLRSGAGVSARTREQVTAMDLIGWLSLTENSNQLPGGSMLANSINFIITEILKCNSPNQS